MNKHNEHTGRRLAGHTHIPRIASRSFLFFLIFIFGSTTFAARLAGQDPAPNLEALLNVSGVDFAPDPQACGQFNLILDLCVANTGYIPGEDGAYGAQLTALRAQLDLEAALGEALIDLDGPPQVITSMGYDLTKLGNPPTAERLPAIRPDYNGRTETELLNTDGTLYPGESFCVRLAVTIDPGQLSPEAAATISFQAGVAGVAESHGYYQQAGGPSMVNDLSSGTWSFDGSYDDPDDPTIFVDCWQQVQPLVVPGQVNISANILCGVCLEPEELITGSADQCGTDAFPLGGFYRISVPGVGEDLLEACVDGKSIVNGKFSYSIRTVNNACSTSWGEVYLEDNTLPGLACWKPHSAVDGKPLFCEDIDLLLLEGVHSYKVGEFGTVVEASEPLKTILDWTGYASAFDNCGELTIYVSDELLDGGDCEDRTIERTFWVEARINGETQSESCIQTLHFTVPHLADVSVPDDAELACTDDFALDANGHPHPEVTGYPEVTSGMGTYALASTFCNLGASYQDSEPVEACGGTYKIFRHWQILDWCAESGSQLSEYDQVIKVVDKQGPEVSCVEPDYDQDGQPDILTFSTGPYDCTAAFSAPLPLVSDACSNWEVLTEVLQDESVLATVSPGADRYISGLAVGCYNFRYTVTDECGNRTVVYCPFYVEDRVAPIAVCNDDLHISIGGAGTARVTAADIDEGSNDNCGTIRVEVRRRILDIEQYECLDNFDLDGNGIVLNDEVRLSAEFGDTDAFGVPGEYFYYTPWEAYVDFSCCDMNENVRIEMRVWDDANGNGWAGDSIESENCFDGEKYVATDNYNVCWLDVLIEDKVAPGCVPPLPVTTDCNALPFDFDPQNELQMASLFGAASGQDNCPGWQVEELEAQTDGLTDCGAGSFVRRFRVTDAKGISSDICEQRVEIRQVHDYWIKFPADAAADCGVPVVDTIMTSEGACDLLAISVQEDRFAASGDECYKIFRTYSVINWCEYDGQADPVVVSRDEDCDGRPGDESVFVIVRTQADPDPCSDPYAGTDASVYQHVWYDRDADPFNTVPAAGTKGEACDYTTNPAGFWKELSPLTENEEHDSDDYPARGTANCDIASTGYWQYTQVIKVYDTTDPVITYEIPDPFCSFSGNEDQGCPADVLIDFRVAENCTPEDLTIQVELDAFADGELDGDLSDQLSGQYPDYTLSGTFPLGDHRLLITVSDGCGNRSGQEILFSVVDCKAPGPICLNGLAVDLMPVIPEEDIDGDGVADNGAVTIWASDFIASPVSDCSGPVSYSINRSLTESPDPSQTSLTLVCGDAPTQLIQIWAYDAAGNADLCETYLMVQDNLVQCDGSQGAIAGTIRTETAVSVPGVAVHISGNTSAERQTDGTGHYRFGELAEGYDYSITPQLDTDPLNGVSTFDLILMSKHILGTQGLESPYQMIAADVNNSGSITSLDAIALRRLILNIDLEFGNNTSWRFVPTAYRFPLPGDPWQVPFPEVAHINDLQGDRGDQEFVGIKIGDLNGSVITDALAATSRGTGAALQLTVAASLLQPNQTERIPVRADDLAAYQGFQGTLQWTDERIEILGIEPGIMEREHFGLNRLPEGTLTFSWYGAELEEPDEPLFTLLVRARQEVQISEVLLLSSRLTRAEAYDREGTLRPLALEFVTSSVPTSVRLEQNFPNPFRGTSQIGFYLPEAAGIQLQIRDASGRLLKTMGGDFGPGHHRLSLDRNELGGSGVLYYTLTSGNFTATRKMIVLD
ncbi:T9SS type A sorting domain-containing protein [Flavilitoribacter nigricans]|uniref:Dockerin domain-containing protein n=1 Tax=Flavilitoribacter nigricans (strain ATCC 23147 / DSM 23189 / NBRC 102662 / NCIMB 1420 / SS-2) TaxID=1122177 RepID=A0A2D0MY51_FLAN2|nr:T9SS type A sorting domain-containing protein [Flavilitoribacter nigricans]PHN01110.1 hypothetical protein CRP01_38895 [Flavilitoribacter nigricans DSM 23189 = NBRC 102662]